MRTGNRPLLARNVGRDYAERQPTPELREAVVTSSRRRPSEQPTNATSATRPAAGVRRATAALAVVFDFLDQHWPYLVNAIESDLIRHEQCRRDGDRRFNQHYRTSALRVHRDGAVVPGVFEKLYRFTPFSDDAQPAVRGKSRCNWPAMTSATCRCPAMQGYGVEWPSPAADHVQIGDGSGVGVDVNRDGRYNPANDDGRGQP